tara:strand:+ start:1147 stop:2799 length:1653 start_codon:yes stop_codon:yes gene_type:complete
MTTSTTRKRGRPPLKPGEKGRYQYSKVQEKKVKEQKKITANRMEVKRAEKRLKNLNIKSKAIQKSDRIAENGGVLDGKLIDQLPSSVRRQLQEDTELIFKPNNGPQTDFLASPEKEVLYGGAAGGGKSYAMLVDLLRYADNPNHKALLLRRTLAELTDLIEQSRKIYPRAFTGAVFRESKSTWMFPSGATALFSYVDKDHDVTRYQGQAFTWIGIDELGHYPSPYVWTYLRSRLRTTDPSIDTYMRASANPGGVGGWWIKKMFIDPAVPNTSFWAVDPETGRILRNPKTKKPLFHRRFIPARLTDNPYLAESGEYESMLLSLPEVERRRLLDGDWDVAEGAAFSEFDRTVHVVEPFELPYNWPRVRAMDYGYSSPSCVLWGAVDWDNNLWIYRELYEKGHTGESIAELILALEYDDPPMTQTVLDGSCWSKHGTGPSIAETMIRNGARFVPADRNRIAGKIEVHRRLSIPDGGEPGLRVFGTCTNLVRTLPTLPLSKTNSEDVDTKADDHAYDALRYLCMTRQTGYATNSMFHSIKQQQSYQPINTTFGY